MSNYEDTHTRLRAGIQGRSTWLQDVDTAWAQAVAAHPREELNADYRRAFLREYEVAQDYNAALAAAEAAAGI